MLIRDEQIAAFAAPLKSSFEERLLAHITEFFPRQCADWTPEELRSVVVRRGCERAARYGIRIERDVCKFIQLTVCLAADFDTSPKYPWASEILRDEVLTDPTAKVNRLHRKAVEHLEEGGVNGRQI